VVCFATPWTVGVHLGAGFPRGILLAPNISEALYFGNEVFAVGERVKVRAVDAIQQLGHILPFKCVFVCVCVCVFECVSRWWQ
jgi:hypothetical protein